MARNTRTEGAGHVHWTLGVIAAVLAAVTFGLGTIAMAQDTPAGNTPPADNKPTEKTTDDDKAREKAEAEAEPDPEKPITVDFINRDVETVFHYIALRSGLNIQVQGSITVKLTIFYRNVKPRDVIEAICKTNELELVQEGALIYIKKRPTETGSAHVVRGATPGKYTVTFESQELVEAIMEVAKVTDTPASIPSIPQTDTPQAPPKTGEAEQKEAARVITIQKRQISMYMRDADPDTIMRRLAEVGDLLLRDPDKASPATGYFFLYKTLAGEFDESGAGGIQAKPLMRKDWIIPGAQVETLKGELKNIMSPRGRLVVDKDTNYIVVIDREDVMEHVSYFLDNVKVNADEKARLAGVKADDPLVARPFAIIRDVADPTVLTTVQSMLSPEGKVNINTDTNTLVVTERQSRMAQLEEVIGLLDAKAQQVYLSARLVEVSLESYMGYGLQLFSSQPVDSWKDGVITGDSRDTASGTVGGLFGNPTGFSPFVGTFVNSAINARLELLANDGKVRTLIEPKQMVSNRKPSKIAVGQEIPYVQNTSQGTGTGTTSATVAFKRVDASMEVTPIILEGGIIRMTIIIAVAEVIGNTAIEGNNTPIIANRESRTDVFIRDGETVVMGGLLRERERMDENGLPFLKDIPFLGYLFKSTNKVSQRTDLMFFLTPTIVNAMGDFNERGGGLEMLRDLTPGMITADDAKNAGIRDGNARMLKPADKPTHYNANSRPKVPADVKPGA